MERRRQPTRPVSVRAYAKINLDLRVLGTRRDGFHELRTVFQSISLHDTVECVPARRAVCDRMLGGGRALDQSNLIWRAAEALWRALRRSGPIYGVGVRLDKRIPLQAGLGGGSADAAAALIGLARTWRVPLRPAQLTDVAATLGADVPFFLAGGTALGLGRGDECIRSRTCRGTGSCCSFPALACPPVKRTAGTTPNGSWRADRFCASRSTYPGPWPSRAGADDQRSRGADRAASSGDRPDEGCAASSRAAAAAMSGSGSAVFGLFQKRSDALAAVGRLDGSGWRVLLTESLGRGEFARLSRPRSSMIDD